MSTQPTWDTAVGDLNPTVLAVRLNADLGVAGEILCQIHRLPHGEERCTTLQSFATSLQQQEEKIRARLWVDELFYQTLINIILEGFICGIPKTEFCGSQFGLNLRYVYGYATILNDSIRSLAHQLAKDGSNSILADQTLRDLRPLWTRLTQLGPVSGLGLPIPESEVDPLSVAVIPATLAAIVGLGCVGLHLQLYAISPARVLDEHLVCYLIRAFCFSLPTLDIDEFVATIGIIFQSIPSHERRGILEETFHGETIARMFMVTCCDHLLGRRGRNQAQGYEVIGVTTSLRITEFIHTAVRDGPELLHRAASSPGILEKVISNTLYACQRARCDDEQQTNTDFGLAFMFLVEIITLPVFKHRRYIQHQFSFDTRVCHVLLSYCALGLRAELGTTPGKAEKILDCIALYALPGATAGLSELSAKRRRDIFNLRSLIDVRVLTVRERLQPMPQSNFKRRAIRILGEIHRALDFEVPPGILYAGRRHRCNNVACECSGITPPHALRVCKGCWSVFYCSKQCQKQDWEQGFHKHVCQRRRAESTR